MTYTRKQRKIRHKKVKDIVAIRLRKRKRKAAEKNK